jgi:GNAT superfamily N-acetyltransferase
VSTIADRRSRPEAGQLAYRPARTDDIPACTQIWHAGLTDYQRRLNQPELPSDLGPLERFLGHLLATDPDRFWVAARDHDGDEELVAFGAASVRGDVWFLGMLFVHPSVQAAGVGRGLLHRTYPGGRIPRADLAPTGEGPTILGTATDSAQPVSNALYARLGLVPRLPVFHFVGRPERSDALPALPRGIRPEPFGMMAERSAPRPGHQEPGEAVAVIDRALLGFEHPADHRFLRADGRDGWLYWGPDGAPVGYGYASPVGRVGPIAALDSALVAPILGHLLGAVAPRGASSIWMPGTAGEAFGGLLRAGLRIEGFPALLCWTRPFADFERYVPISLALI